MITSPAISDHSIPCNALRPFCQVGDAGFQDNGQIWTIIIITWTLWLRIVCGELVSNLSYVLHTVCIFSIHAYVWYMTPAVIKNTPFINSEYAF